MIWIMFFIFLCYGYLITALSIGFSKVKAVTFKDATVQTKFSVVIPFRNEAARLPQLLASLLALNYPKALFEVILVDDDSTDNSHLIIQEILNKAALQGNLTPSNCTIIQNSRSSNSPKKDAILTAITQAKYDWIVTTDADCIVPKNWLAVFDACIQKNKPKMVVAPVSYEVKKTFLEQFQLLDFYSLQAATIGGFGIKKPFLCNGANLCYCKTDFIALHGFQGNDEIASGDDIFLFEKFVQNDKESVQFLKSEAVIVTTFPVKNWQALLQQRVRWAAKSSHYTLAFTKLVGSVIFFTNLGLVILTFMSLFGKVEATLLLAFWLLKLTVDALLLRKTLHFFKQKKSLFWYLLSSVLYPFFSCFIALKAMTTNYVWKGRTFKK